MLTGRLAGATSKESTYHFMRDIIGYDLAAFFERHVSALRAEVASVLEALLRTE